MSRRILEGNMANQSPKCGRPLGEVVPDAYEAGIAYYLFRR